MPQKTNVKLVDAGGVINPITGGLGQAVDGQTVVADGRAILLVYPPNGQAYAGPWIPAAGTWTRATDWDATGDITPGDWWYVEQGTEYQGTTWHFEDPAAPATLNTTPVTIGMFSRRRALAEGSGIDISGTTPPVVSFNAPSDVQTSFIEGLRVEYISANSLRVHAGACYIPSVGVVSVDTDIDMTGLVLTFSTWYYLYAYDAGSGILAVDPPSTQAPTTTPYRGDARTKGPDLTPDLSRRYIGAIYASGANTIRRFSVLPGGFVRWKVAQTSLTAISGVGNVNYNDTSVAAYQPPTSRAIFVMGSAVNTTNATQLHIAGDEVTTGTATDGTIISVVTGSGNGPRVNVSGVIENGTLNAVRHREDGASGVHAVYVHGYYERL